MGGRVFCVWGDVDTKECGCGVGNKLEDGVGVCVSEFCTKFEETCEGWVAAS